MAEPFDSYTPENQLSGIGGVQIGPSLTALSGAPPSLSEIPGLPGSVVPPINQNLVNTPPSVSPPSTNNSSAACQTGGSGSGGGGATGIGAQNNNGLNSNGLNPQIKAASLCGIQNFEAKNPGFKAYAFSGVGSRPAAGSDHPKGLAVDYAIYGTDNTLINNLRTNDSPASAVYAALYNNVNQCQTNAGGQPFYWGGNFQSGQYRADTMHVGFNAANPANGRSIKATFPNAVRDHLGDNENSTTYTGPTEGAVINRLDNSKTAPGNAPPAALGSKSNAPLNSSGSNSSAACASPTSGGCAAAAPGAAPVAAAAAAGAGLGGLLTSAIGQISQVAGQIAQGGLPAAAQGLAQLATQGAAGAAMLPTTVSQTVSNFASNAGGAAFNAVRGFLAQ